MLTFIALIAALSWIWLTLMNGGFWRASERLGAAPDPEKWPEIVAVIPARNEADSIANVVGAHVKAEYPGDFSIIVADDGSHDGTGDLARGAAAGSSRTVDVINVPPLPEGWSGKLWAVEAGLEHARKIAPHARYILLTDADIALAPDTLTRIVAKAESNNLALTSLMARLDARGPWASFLIPAFVFFFQKLYPFPRVNDGLDNMAAAAGGCMLVRADALDAIEGVESIKGALIDDCALARKIKDISPSTKIWLGLADDEAVSVRDNQSLTSIWNMVARTAYAQLHRSPLWLAGAVLGMIVIYVAPPWILLTIFGHWSTGAAFFSMIACILMACTYWPTLRLYKRAWWEAVLLPVAAALYTAMTITSAWRDWRGAGGQWKGRTY